jgi:ketosteroid isomerase-like protein
LSDTRAVVEDFFAKHAATDPSVVELFADEIDFFAPGDPKHFPWAGHHTRGGAELAEVIKLIWASRTAGKGTVASSTLVVDGEDAVWVGRGVSHEISGESSNAGERFTLDVALHFTVRGGKIIQLHAIEDMTALAQAYGYL